MNDDFKYINFMHLPTIDGEISPSAKTKKYSVKLDTAIDVSESFFNFSKAFYTSAELIVDRMLSKCHIDELDKYFFPVFFLYRHSIELLLKSIGCMVITSQNARAAFFRDTFHDPESIYNYIVSRTSTLPQENARNWISQYFHNIAYFDKASDSFRYPYHIDVNYDFSNNKSYVFTRVFQKQTHVDLIKETNKMSAAYEILNNWRLDFIDPNYSHISSEYINIESTFLDEGGNYYEQSVVGYEFQHNDFYAHCHAYLECGNFLKQYMISEFDSGKSLMNHLIYPMCYLYRNDVELFLKAIIFEFSDFSLQPRLKIMHTQKHSIRNLFNCVENEILPLYDISENDAYITLTKNYCYKLQNFDSDSSKFRYPVNKDCFPYQKTIRYYNFVDLGVFLESLCNALNGIHGTIQDRHDIIIEMKREYSDY